MPSRVAPLSPWVKRHPGQGTERPCPCPAHRLPFCRPNTHEPGIPVAGATGAQRAGRPMGGGAPAEWHRYGARRGASRSVCSRTMPMAAQGAGVAGCSCDAALPPQCRCADCNMNASILLPPGRLPAAEIMVPLVPLQRARMFQNSLLEAGRGPHAVDNRCRLAQVGWLLCKLGRVSAAAAGVMTR